VSHGYKEIPRRPLTLEEDRWVKDLVAANDGWRGIHTERISAVAVCTCGCRSIFLQQSDIAQRPELVGHQGLVAEMSLRIKAEDKEDVVSILLHHANGCLSLLEIVWYNFPVPVPAVWTEISRELRSDG
jgi:hypothetical protein